MDNYYIIEEATKCIQKQLTLKKYKSFQGLANDSHRGFARIYVLASEIVAYTDNEINIESLSSFIRSYQNKKVLNMEELWNITIFLQLAIIENIRDICEKIYISCLEKYKVESMIERLVEQKEPNQVIFKAKKMNYVSDVQFTFIEHLSYRLKKIGKQGLPYLDILEEEVKKMGMTLSDVIRKEHFDLTLKRVSMGNAIRSLKELSNINLETVFEQINEVEEILKQDPAGVYEKMDYKTKILYRNKIEELSKKTKISEIYIANKVIELCNNIKEFPRDNISDDSPSLDMRSLATGKEKILFLGNSDMQSMPIQRY